MEMRDFFEELSSQLETLEAFVSVEKFLWFHGVFFN